MTSHDRFLHLAAAAIDNPLPAADRQRLTAHLDTCRACARDAADLRSDAVAFAELPLLVLPTRRGEAILGAALAPSGGAHPMRLILIAAALALLLVGTLAVGAQLVRRAEQLDVVPPAPSLVAAPSASPAPVSPAVSWTPIGSLPAAAGSIVDVAGFDGGYVAISSAGADVWFSPDGRSWESVALPVGATGGESRALSAQTHGVAGKGSTVVVVGSYRSEPCADPVDHGSTTCPTSPVSWTSTDGRHWTSGFPGPMPTAPADHAQGGLLGPVYPTVTGGWDAVVAYWDGDGTLPTELLHSANGLAWAPVLDEYGQAVMVDAGAGSATSIERGLLPRAADGNWLMPVSTGDLTLDGRATVELSADAVRWLDDVQLPVPDGAQGTRASSIRATGAGFVTAGSYWTRMADDTRTTYRMEWVSPDGRVWTMVTPLDTHPMAGVGGVIADGPAGILSLVGYAGTPGQTDVLLLH